jgi:uncharacterized protein YciI
MVSQTIVATRPLVELRLQHFKFLEFLEKKDKIKISGRGHVARGGSGLLRRRVPR